MSGPATRAIGASRSSKQSSMTTHASQAPVEPRPERPIPYGMRSTSGQPT